REDALLIVGRGVELARAATAAALINRGAPGHLLVVDALLGFEKGRSPYRGHRRQGRREACRRGLILAACVGAAVAAGHEMRHSQRHRAVLDARVRVAMAA